MAQTTEIFPIVRRIYKKLFKSKALNNFIHFCLGSFVDSWSKIKSFYFPLKFNWEWKWEMLSRRFERDTVALFKKIIKPGMSVVDIGAHIGYYTTFFAQLVGPTGTIYAFEPDPDNFELLKLNTKKYQNIKLYNLAVADQVGIIKFYKVRKSTGCHSIVPTNDSIEISVPATTLDRFVSDSNIKPIDIIKIDIEGGESLAFAGMHDLFTNAKNLSIITEFNPSAMKTAGLEPGAFIENIENLGFKIYHILPRGEVRPLQHDDLPALKYYDTGFVNLMLKK